MELYLHALFMEAIPLCLSLNIVHLFSLTQTQVHCNTVSYLYMYATCFDLNLGHPQACQYKHLTKEDTRIA